VPAARSTRPSATSDSSLPRAESLAFSPYTQRHLLLNVQGSLGSRAGLVVGQSRTGNGSGESQAQGRVEQTSSRLAASIGSEFPGASFIRPVSAWP